MVTFPRLGQEMDEGSTLKLQCRCGHLWTFTRAEALKLYGGDATPYGVRRNSRCGACGERGDLEAFVSS